MHYIRFFKVPYLSRESGNNGMIARVTITTDLGESYLSTNVELEVVLDTPLGILAPSTKPQHYTWAGRDGMRCLSVSVPVVPSNAGMVTMSVRPVDPKYAIESFQDVLQASSHGGIAPVRSVEVSMDGNRNGFFRVAERRFSTSSGSLHIWEETGESIARHIWDAGVVLSAYICEVSQHLTISSLPEHLPKLPKLQTLLSKPDLNVLELGAGCGVVGLTIARCLPNISTMILTDLDEADEILDRNLSIFSPKSPQTKVSHIELDWTTPLPPIVASTHWSLIVVADCTYNPDVVPDLVKTLSKLKEVNQDVMVLLAMKVRHESEMVFFELMSESGWKVDEKCKIPLAMADESEDQEIEIFLFL